MSSDATTPGRAAVVPHTADVSLVAVLDMGASAIRLAIAENRARELAERWRVQDQLRESQVRLQLVNNLATGIAAGASIDTTPSPTAMAASANRSARTFFQMALASGSGSCADAMPHTASNANNRKCQRFTSR